MPNPLSWIEVDSQAIKENLQNFKRLLPKRTRLMAVVKGEAYGHGMVSISRISLDCGADWLGVFHLEEALKLRKAGVNAPILVLGYVLREDLAEAIANDISITVSSLETIEAISEAIPRMGKRARLHLKLETGTYRLGLDGEPLEQVLSRIKADQQLFLEGIHTHYANIEDTTEHDYARGQLDRFSKAQTHIRQLGLEVPLPHTACTAATILFPETYFEMVRVGIGMYGLWPSKETYLSALQKGISLQLRPALTWKTRVVQVKSVPKGSYIGYGCTYRTTRVTTLAILPIGYANGYDRLLSNRGHVLIRGMRGPIRGRVCMNLCMVDVTDISGVSLEDEVVLLGRQGEEQITAEQMASWAQTINYEVVARVDPLAPRKFLGLENRS